MSMFDGLTISQSTFNPDDIDPEELAMMEEAYGGERYRTICACGADLEDAPLSGCEAPFAHGDDVYK